MNIVHVCLNSPYTDGWGYQENIMPGCHRKFGHTVTVIAQNKRHIDSGEVEEAACDDYFLNDGVRVIRVAKQKMLCSKLMDVFSPYDIYGLLCALRPDFIMVHGLMGSISALQVKKYIKKNSSCAAVADIHQDYYNSPVNSKVKDRVLMSILRQLNRTMYPYYKKIFFIAPSCKKFAEEYYMVPHDKLELLPLGCVQEVGRQQTESVRAETRKKFGLKDDDIVVCHGGKLDVKKKSLELIRAIKALNKENSSIKLIIFGSLSDEIQQPMKNEISDCGGFIKYAGMLTPDEYYKIYKASDIAVFPGGQSALWQQAIACGLAVVVKRHFGAEYLDLGGNIDFLEDGSSEEIYEKLKQITDSSKYEEMKRAAKEKGAGYFSYERISLSVLKYANGEANNEH
ncbi:glycosyltransferase family 4 protein [Sedimentibacter sp.]|uniref:glycosyltransferase family 4 protein n=1 Tax=Sedimentibacter sp. TaxID=1960295 RepID=UPI00315865BA